MTLDRLYLPAGQWKNIYLGNLPVRTAERPLVITNKGLTRWSATVTVNGGNTPVTYHADDVVVHGAEPRIYRATGDTTAEPGSGGGVPRARVARTTCG